MELLKEIYKFWIFILNALYEAGNPFFSIFGGFRSNNKYSEFSIWKKTSIIKQIYLIFVPGINWLQGHLSKLISGNHTCLIKDKKQINRKEEEFWIFINGMGTTREIFNMNVKYLKTIFKRPINGIYNTTDSILVDFIECLIDKETSIMSDPAHVTLIYILDAIYKYDKIVIIAHSQGALIISQVLIALKSLDLKVKHYKKIEIYAFGNTASKMEYIHENYPYIETLANEFDFFSKLSNNVNNIKLKDKIKVDGEIFIRKNKYGHLLNIHYLDGFDQERTNEPLYLNKTGEPSKLYKYIGLINKSTSHTSV